MQRTNQRKANKPLKQQQSRRTLATKKSSMASKKSVVSKAKRSMTSSSELKQDISLHDAFVPAKQRTYRNWTSKPVSVDAVKKAYDTIKYGPTAFNSSPLRIAIVQTPEAKAKFAPTLMGGNVDPMKNAPITAILAYDSAFADKLDFLSPNYDGAQKYLAANPQAVAPTAQLNAHLQAGYFIAALRTQGFDLGPANGFDSVKADEILFAGNDATKTWKSFMYVNIGHATQEGVFPRAPRFDFEQASTQI